MLYGSNSVQFLIPTILFLTLSASPTDILFTDYRFCIFPTGHELLPLPAACGTTHIPVPSPVIVRHTISSITSQREQDGYCTVIQLFASSMLRHASVTSLSNASLHLGSYAERPFACARLVRAMIQYNLDPSNTSSCDVHATCFPQNDGALQPNVFSRSDANTIYGLETIYDSADDAPGMWTTIGPMEHPSLEISIAARYRVPDRPSIRPHLLMSVSGIISVESGFYQARRHVSSAPALVYASREFSALSDDICTPYGQ